MNDKVFTIARRINGELQPVFAPSATIPLTESEALALIAEWVECGVGSDLEVVKINPVSKVIVTK